VCALFNSLNATVPCFVVVVFFNLLIKKKFKKVLSYYKSLRVRFQSILLGILKCQESFKLCIKTQITASYKTIEKHSNIFIVKLPNWYSDVHKN
jgi:hypothetical protein